MLMESMATTPSLQTPQGQAQTLIAPPWNGLESVVDNNIKLRQRYEYDVQGKTIAELENSARQRLLQQAAKYTSQYRNLPNGFEATPELASSPIILAGHQPQLFHPGVWFKNFALSQLASNVAGTGVNLLIDSDVVRSVSVRVPVQRGKQIAAEAVPFDQPQSPIPFEERQIQDTALFDSFGERVSKAIRPLVAKPLIDLYWPKVVEHRKANGNLGACLASSRHALEETWGNETLELPASSICQFPEFHQFTAHLLANAPRFARAHNESLARYRKANHLRSHAHPAPDLQEQDRWVEAPFWIWTEDQPTRRHLFVRDLNGTMQLSDLAQWTVEIPLSADGNADAAVEFLSSLDTSGVRIRSRALITTLFARLFLGDLFLHGIGGGKYDHVTNDIATSFFGLKLPDYGVISATLRLPIQTSDVSNTDEQLCRQRINSVPYHPENFLPPKESWPKEQAKEIESLIQRKKSWIETPKTYENAIERHQAITQINAALAPLTSKQLEKLAANHKEIESSLQSNAILRSREYAFCLHPQKSLQGLMLDSFSKIP